MIYYSFTGCRNLIGLEDVPVEKFNDFTGCGMET